MFNDERQEKTVFKYRVIPHNLAQAKTRAILRTLAEALGEQKRRGVGHEANCEYHMNLEVGHEYRH